MGPQQVRGSRLICGTALGPRDHHSIAGCGDFSTKGSVSAATS